MMFAKRHPLILALGPILAIVMIAVSMLMSSFDNGRPQMVAGFDKTDHPVLVYDQGIMPSGQTTSAESGVITLNTLVGSIDNSSYNGAIIDSAANLIINNMFVSILGRAADTSNPLNVLPATDKTTLQASRPFYDTGPALSSLASAYQNGSKTATDVNVNDRSGHSPGNPWDARRSVDFNVLNLNALIRYMKINTINVSQGGSMVSFVDFLIDGAKTQTFAASSSSPSAFAAGGVDQGITGFGQIIDLSSTASYSLTSRWSLITWAGAGNESDNAAAPGTSGKSLRVSTIESVTAVYGRNALGQLTLLSLSGVNVPGTVMVTLNNNEAYWTNIADTGQAIAVTWTRDGVANDEFVHATEKYGGQTSEVLQPAAGTNFAAFDVRFANALPFIPTVVVGGGIGDNYVSTTVITVLDRFRDIPASPFLRTAALNSLGTVRDNKDPIGRASCGATCSLVTDDVGATLSRTGLLNINIGGATNVLAADINNTDNMVGTGAITAPHDYPNSVKNQSPVSKMVNEIGSSQNYELNTVNLTYVAGTLGITGMDLLVLLGAMNTMILLAIAAAVNVDRVKRSVLVTTGSFVRASARQAWIKVSSIRRAFESEDRGPTGQAYWIAITGPSSVA